MPIYDHNTNIKQFRPMKGVLSNATAKSLVYGYLSLPQKLAVRNWYAQTVIKNARKIRNLLSRESDLNQMIYEHNYSFIPECKPDSMPKHASESEICVRFSGGMDSMLAAATVAQHFQRVHLVTFYTAPARGLSQEFNPKKILPSVELLKKHFGPEKFVYKIKKLDPLREYIYFKHYTLLFHPSNYFEIVSVCPACVMSMHIELMVYCLEHNISYAVDGANSEIGPVRLAMQNPFALQGTKKFYSERNVTYLINPAYHIPRSDHALYEMGITRTREIKKTQRQKETQQECYFSQFELLVSKLLGIREDDYLAVIPETADLVTLYFSKYFQSYIKYIDRRLSGESIDQALLQFI
jgi:hypothetical protein